MNDLEYWQSCVGPGWSVLVDIAFRQCQAHGVEITDVKEKWGLLRIYIADGDDGAYAFLNTLETLSGYVCERCGEPGKPRGGSWIKTLCDRHAGGGDG